MLIVDHLRKDFTGVRAVDDVSFAVRRGQIFGLIGPNGAGKSTTIRMIMNIIKPDRGNITIEGQPLSDSVLNMTGYLPEERGLYKKSKLLRVITYFGSLKGMSPREAKMAAGPYLEMFSLSRYERSAIEELSKGNQQKVQFIISVLHSPGLLVLDELFSGLDPINQVLMKDALMQLKSDNRAIVFSTHQMENAEKLCDDLILINKGNVVLSGSPADIKRSHGRNAVQLTFEGDGCFLSSLPGVQSADISGNSAEVELDENIDTNAFIASLLPRLRLSSFSRIEPSLHSIFISTVRETGE